ncbi:hypothetical protein BABINDRAFT_159852 [Babjeviella inositovora NRRL Y-12698]|uniref:aspartyl aminopeptidase n=1 Tax=Babjeviella inositovora NRRL Y-12698 TaxID=984486 RepID=A0A1E3QV97_9ASCO|nr:uncharacterized protein BABINDRAFT_159852 [Babjeviella inositovora NRRL Y-12698]ODQ81580.1 hypothetical protein BABINDRAFT_159852 [Babjeviella inositovora NRRL Y-12698]
MSAIEAAQKFVNFVNVSPTPYHAVNNIKLALLHDGFTELSERTGWNAALKPGQKYFVTRNNSSIIAFTVGGEYVAGNGIAVVGAHTDSPTLRLKPVSKKSSEGFIQVGVECYGGGLWHTWFDRDLSVAGRVFISDKQGNYVGKLVKIDKPILRIPTLAIHLSKEREKFEFNKEAKLVPIAGQQHIKAEQNDHEHSSCGAKPTEEQFSSIKATVERHNEGLLELLATELDVAVSQIEDFELVLYDHQKSTLGGLHDEFIFSPRLDNLTSCFCATEGLLASTKTLDTDAGISMIALFDHEEIGSSSAQGADGTFLPDVLARLTAFDFATGAAGNFKEQALSKSFLLSSDQAHGVHPNYADIHEAQNKPQLNRGPVIKINANQRYATNSAGIVLIKQMATAAEVPLQLFVVRNDSPCGSTIGPILASKLGMTTLDLGNPQLSMHSIRETGGTFDVERLTKLFGAYFGMYAELEPKVLVDGV